MSYNKIDSDFEKYTEVKDMIKEAKLGLIDEKVDKLADKKDYLGILEFLNESLDDNKDLKKNFTSIFTQNSWPSNLFME